MDIVITLPQKIEWEDYQSELDDVADGSGVLNYRIPGTSFTLNPGQGNRCYLVWRGKVRGWMLITGIDCKADGFTCQTTGRWWPPGVYIQRSGPFHRLKNPIPMKGFRGWRRAPDEWRKEAPDGKPD